MNPAQRSLEAFVTRAQGFYVEADGSDGMDFVRYVLAGRDGEDHIFVNAAQGLDALEDSTFDVTRDFDSAIGITENLPFIAPLAIFPLSPFSETLTRKCNGVVGHVFENDRKIDMDLHSIPNIGLGKVRNRHITRVFFPRLYRAGESTSISPQLLTKIYDKCLRPAVIEVIPVDQSRWPVNYDAAMRQARGSRGTLHFGTIDISMWDLDTFSEAFRRNLDQIPELADSYYMHELRGTKGGSRHDPSLPESCNQALDDVLEFLDADRIEMDEWYIDVGINVSKRDHVLQWRTSSHSSLLHFILPSISLDRLNSWTKDGKSSRKYSLDRSAQLRDFGGFRSVPSKRGRTDQIHYINVYTTEKSAHYQLHSGGLFRRRLSKDLLSKGIIGLLKDLQSILDVVKQCAGMAGEEGLEGNARFEVRVPLSKANDILLNLPEDLIQTSVVAVPLQIWWLFKWYRLAAVTSVIESLRNAPSGARSWHQSLLLGSILIYMHNALFYRPAEGSIETEITNACCLQVSNNEDGSDDDDDGVGTHPILYERGLYFLSDLIKDHSIRLPSQIKVEQKVLATLYQKGTYLALTAEFTTANLDDQLVERNSNRISNKKKRTTDIRFLHGSDAIPAPETTFGAKGVKVKRPITMSGPDVIIPNLEDEDDLSQDIDPDRIVSVILAQFPLDVIATSPNKKKISDGPYVLLSPDQRDDVTVDLFKSVDLRGVLEAISYTSLPAQKWWSLQFEKYFPPKGTTIAKSAQNFPRLTYFQDWMNLMSRVSPSNAQIIRKDVYETFFSHLQWLPLAQSDRMWSTKKPDRQGWKLLPAGFKGPCPQIAINRSQICNGMGIQVGLQRPDDDAEDHGEDSEGSAVDE